MKSRCKKFIRVAIRHWFVFPLLIGVLILQTDTQAGYSITDQDGRVLSEDPGNTLVTGPTNQTIILNDRSNRKVFELFWDATGGAVTIKGDRVHLKIHSSGRIEKWTEFENMPNEPYPLFIAPEVRIGPNPPRSAPTQK
jgi:hypothetical protein